MRPSADDVAKAAGVSRSTVSRALRGLPRVDEQTRARVQAAATELGYRPHAAAVSLASGSTGAVGMVVPTFKLAYFGHLIAAVSEVLSEADRSLVLYRVPDGDQHEFMTGDAPFLGRVDNLILANGLPDFDDPVFASLSSIVTVGCEDERFSSVCADDYGGAVQGMQYLLNRGHRHIGALVGPIDDTVRHQALRSRVAGWRDLAKKSGAMLTEVRSEIDFAGGAEAMSNLLTQGDCPTAIVAASDEMAVGALGVARGVGIQVPKELSIVGFDDHGLAAAVGLTTINQSIRDQGHLAARLVIDLPDEPVHDLVLTGLVLRSSAAGPGEDRETDNQRQ